MTEKPSGGPLADKVTWVREKLDRQRAESKNASEHGSPPESLPYETTDERSGESMPDATDPELPAAITDEAQAAAMQPVDDKDVVKKTTHEVDTDDMFKPSA